MRNLATVVLMVCCLVSSVSAQMPLVPEHELLSLADSIFSSGSDLEVTEMKCGEYFLYAGADSRVPLITFNMKRLPSDKPDIRLLVVMQKRNVEVRIENAKKVPTAEVIPGPKLILRINRADFEKSTRCLPRPLGA